MKVSSAWIKYWLRRTMLTDAEVVTALERAGMEVESVDVSVEIDKHVVVGLVKKVVQHPQSDHLKLLTIYDGSSDFSVVCGALNVRTGLKVAFAQIGAVLPGGETIGEVKLRGELSRGMLCSERELALGRDHDGIIELDSEAEVGVPVRDLFPADSVIDLTTPANRFDVLSVVGLAREVAAMSQAKLAALSPSDLSKPVADPAVKPHAEAGRYMLARLKVRPHGRTPSELTARLRAAGMRPLMPVVDVTNYVMLELGQPLHAFDAAKVKLPVEVRRARAGETLVTLDGIKRKLQRDDLVIADATGPIALAGVMGGASTEVSPQTTEVLLEAAVFDGAAVRMTAKRHGLRSEASARFERGLPVELPPLGLARTVQMLGEVSSGELISYSDQNNTPSVKRKIELTIERLNRILGFGVTYKEATTALENLQIGVGEGSKNMIVVPEVPWWRPDLKLPEDLAEEVVRVLGYDRVPSTLPPWQPKRLVFDRDRAKRRQVRDLLYGSGLFEVATYSFVSEDQLRRLAADPEQHLKLKNPLSSEQAYLRSSLVPSHLAVLARNRHYRDTVGFYELSAAFVKEGGDSLPDEPLRLGVMMARPERSYAYVKGILDALAKELNLELDVEPADMTWFAPGRAARVSLGGRAVGWIGQIHPTQLRELKVGGEAGYLELDMEPLLAAAGTRQFAGVQRFPVIVRDVSVLVPTAVTWAQVRSQAVPPVEFVGDYYGPGVPEGFKAMTLRLTVAKPDRTPTEAEAMSLEEQLVSRLTRKLGAKKRD